MWGDPDRARALGREKAELEGVVLVLDRLARSAGESAELLALAIEEKDTPTLAGIEADLQKIESETGGLEFRRMFSGEMD